MRKESLLTISERTGYSISTISRVLNHQSEKYRISKKTVDIIIAEAKRCNYTPSLLAKGLRTNKTNTIGLLIPSIDNPYFANIAHVIIQEAKSHGYTIILVDTMESERNEAEGVNSLLSRKVDGIVVVPCGQGPALLEKVNDNEVPVVLIDRYFASSSLSYVSTDNYQGGLLATRHLISRGHKKIACIQGTPFSMPVKERVRGYVEAMKEAGLDKEINISGEDFSIRNGYLETKLLLNNAEKDITAIFALSNTILLGAIKAINESGMKIPDDISLVSFDNYTYLDFLNPPITRISQPTEEIGTLAIKIIIQNIVSKSTGEGTKILLPPTLLERESVL